MRFARSSASTTLVSDRLLLSLGSRQTRTMMKRRLATNSIAMRPSSHFPVGNLFALRNATSLEPYGIRDRRFLCAAAAAAAPSDKGHKTVKKGKRRSTLERRNTPKQLSYKNGHDYKANPSSKNATATRRGSNRKHKPNRRGSPERKNRGSSNPRKKFTSGGKYDNKFRSGVSATSSSVVPSVGDQWDNETNTSDRASRIPGRSQRPDPNTNDRFNSGGRRRTHNFQLDRFRDKQQEYCESLEEYRLFWHPAAGSDQQRSDPKTEEDSLNRNDDDDNLWSDWRTAAALEHPNPSENFPWLELSWDKVVVSEDLFRKVCATHHELFVSCASYLADVSEATTPSHHHLGENAVDYYEYSDEDDSTEEDRIRLECEDLLSTILPSWERLRRERALLVEAYRPEVRTADDDVDEAPSISPPLDHNSSHDIDISQLDAPPEGSYQNNRLVGWLKQMIAGTDHGGEENQDRGPRVTAHADPECAPNHYHYSKLVGRLYFHYQPLERHNRWNPFHLYSQSEKEDSIEPRKKPTNHVDDDNDESENGTSHNRYKTPYQEALATWEAKRFEILAKRSEQMQYIVDQSLLPLLPNRNNNGTIASKPQHRAHDDDDEYFENSSARVLTDKIVRLLIRSYLDMESLSAAQQAERVYHRHPNHRKRLLWYVTMCYLKVIGNNNKALAKAAGATNYHHHTRKNEQQHEKELFLQRNQESCIAAKRICELVSSKHAKEAREFQHCSTIAFEALAILPQHGRRGLKGYFDRVHSLGILKFGPKVWEALLKGKDAGSPPALSNKDKSHGGRSSRRRKRKANRKLSLDAPSSSTDTPTSSPDEQPAKPPIDLSQFLHSKDHRILSYLIQIYSHEDKDLQRALRLLDVSLDLYPPHDLKESIDRSTFHKLIRKLSEQKRKAFLEQNKKTKSPHSPQNGNANGNTAKHSEFETALGLLDSMVSDETWFPNEETFRILFTMIPYCENPGRDAERLRSKLEGCRFLSGLSSGAQRSRRASKNGETFAFSEVPYLLNPLEASALTLRAWLQTLQQRGGVLPPSEGSPSQRALAILGSMRVGSSSLFSPEMHFKTNESESASEGDSESGSDSESDDDEFERRDLAAFPSGNGRIDINPPPTAALYSLALEVCSRDGGSPRATLDAAMDIFRFLQSDGLLLEGTTCRALLGVLADFSSGNGSSSSASSRELHHDLLASRVEATKKVCEALVEENPDYGEDHPSILAFLQEQSSYLRLRHPRLYEEHLSELGLLDGISESASASKFHEEDRTVIEGLGDAASIPKA